MKGKSGDLQIGKFRRDNVLPEFGSQTGILRDGKFAMADPLPFLAALLIDGYLRSLRYRDQLLSEEILEHRNVVATHGAQ